uniref:Polysaccharide deacetylase n=1 Tax=Cyanothece sp. (strain PCC 7425 / ATCC 29141) TaxID=395961 RepID=B8HRB0_CYAP4
MYHRIADLSLDPWGLAVSPHNFAEHLQVLRQQAHPLTLAQLVQAHQQGQVPDRAVVLTFDDGYLDNFQTALPLLEQQDIPATCFVTTGYTGQGREFWWDELARLLLQPIQLPPELTLTLAAQTQTWPLGPAASSSPATRQQERQYKAWEAPTGSRLAFYYAVWSQLRSLTDTQQQQALADIRTWTAAPSSPGPEGGMALEHLIALDRGGLITIGAHTVTHPLLSAQSHDRQLEEIQGSKQTLEDWLNHPVSYFAYPFGDYGPETVRLTREAGFACACTVESRPAWRGCDLFELPRFGVENWNGEELAQHLSKWFYY